MGLDSRGIIRFFEWFETEEKLFIAMEIVLAVQYLHEKNIVHRGLKPENILLTSKVVDAMRPKLADFGLARMNMKTKDCKTFCGTPHYFAPEVIHTFQDKDAGQPGGGYGKQADMWSLGVILYIMLSGIPPFEEDGLYEQIVNGRYEFDGSEWDMVSLEAKELVRQLMHVNPKGRLTIQQTLSHKWFSLEDRPTPPDQAFKPNDVREHPTDVEATAKRRRTSCGGDEGAMAMDSTAVVRAPFGA